MGICRVQMPDNVHCIQKPASFARRNGLCWHCLPSRKQCVVWSLCLLPGRQDELGPKPEQNQKHGLPSALRPWPLGSFRCSLLCAGSAVAVERSHGSTVRDPLMVSLHWGVRVPCYIYSAGNVPTQRPNDKDTTTLIPFGRLGGGQKGKKKRFRKHAACCRSWMPACVCVDKKSKCLFSIVLKSLMYTRWGFILSTNWVSCTIKLP